VSSLVWRFSRIRGLVYSGHFRWWIVFFTASCGVIRALRQFDPKTISIMSDKQQQIADRIHQLREILIELTELSDLQGSPFRFLALIGTQATDPDDGEAYISSEIFSAAGTEDLGDMLATLVQAALEEEEDNPMGQQYLIESVLTPVREFLGEGEEE
jgi:hypothetical protein